MGNTNSNDLLACEKIFGQVRGNEIRELVERTSGQLCPCMRDLPCPLVAAFDPAAASAG